MLQAPVFSSAAVTWYVPISSIEMIRLLPLKFGIKTPSFVQLKTKPVEGLTVAVSNTVCPGRIFVTAGVAVKLTTGNGFAITVTVAVASHPLPFDPVTV